MPEPPWAYLTLVILVFAAGYWTRCAEVNDKLKRYKIKASEAMKGLARQNGP